MDSATGKRVVIGSVLAVVTIAEVRRVQAGEGMNVRIPVGGLIAAAFLTAAAGPAPDVAAMVALTALVATAVGEGPAVLDGLGRGVATVGPLTTDGPRLAHPGGIGLPSITPQADLNGGRTVRLQTQWGGIVASPTFAARLGPMIAAAAAAGHKLHGTAWRSSAQQIQLRKDHCCTDPNSSTCGCGPPTAPPGTSRHESGNAIDFSGLTPGALAWLHANAATYQIYNLPSESWHWSIDGK